MVENTQEFGQINFHIEQAGTVEQINDNTNSKDDLAVLDGDGDLDAESQHIGDIDDPNDTSLKDIDDTLDFGASELGDNSSSLVEGMSPSNFVMNGNNV